MDTLLELVSQRHPPSSDKEVSKAQAEDIVCVFPLHGAYYAFASHVSRSIHGSHLAIGSAYCRYRMFEPNMDEYLDEEIDSLKQTFEHTCRDWEKKVSFLPSPIRTQFPELILDACYVQTSVHADVSPLLATQQPTFLASSSPAHLKSNVLSTFTNLLLIPVSIVPRTVETVSGAAVHGIAMLDPRRWGGGGQVNGSRTAGRTWRPTCAKWIRIVRLSFDSYETSITHRSCVIA